MTAGTSAGTTARAQLLWVEIRVGVERERARQLYDEACALAERSGDNAALTHARVSFSLHLLYTAQRGAVPMIEQALAEPGLADDRELQVSALWSHSITRYYGDDYPAALEITDQILEACDGDLILGCAMIGYSAWLIMQGLRASLFALTGDAKNARACRERALEDYGPRHHLTSQLIQSFVMNVDSLWGDHRGALALGSRIVSEMGKREGPADALSVFIYLTLGTVQARAGEFERACSSIERSLDTFAHMTAEGLGWLAYAYLMRGSHERAAEILHEACECAAALDQTIPLIQIHVTRARLIRTRESDGLAPEAVERIEAELHSAEVIVRSPGAIALLPAALLERAELLEQQRDVSLSSRAGPAGEPASRSASCILHERRSRTAR